MHVRTLVVKKNSFVRRVRRRAVNFPTQFFARQIAVIPKQLRTSRSGKALKLGGGSYVEASKKQRAMLQQTGIDELLICLRPFGQIDVLCIRRDDERQRSVRLE